MSEFKIREAVLSDVEGIAYVHVESWKTTYHGLLPQEVISERTLERRTQLWKGALSTPAVASSVFVAESDGRIVAFAQFGLTRSPELAFSHELYVIYGLKEFHGRGVGQALVRAGVHWLIDHSAESMMLWVLEGNTVGRRFYEKLGGRVVGRRVDPISSTLVYELAYGWHDLSALAGAIQMRTHFPHLRP